MFKLIDLIVKRIIAYPIVAVGMCLSFLATGLIEVGAWVLDINTDEIEVESDEG